MEKQEYIKTMAAAFGVTIDEAQTLQLLDLSTEDINKSLLAMVTGPSLTDLEKLKTFTADSRVKQFDQRIKDYEQRINDHSNDVKAYLRRLYNVSRERDGAMGRKSLAQESLGKVLHDGFYQLEEVTADKVVFRTRDIMLHNPDIGRTIPMGILGVIVKDGNIEVYPIANTTSVEGYYHPHVSKYGAVCWGTAQAIISSMADTEDYYSGLMALKSILQQYNSDSPYKQFHRWLTGPVIGSFTLSEAECDEHEISTDDSYDEIVDDCPHDSDECDGDCDRDRSYKFLVYRYEGKEVLSNLEEVPSGISVTYT